MRSRAVGRSRPRARGGAAVEFALVLPLFLAIVFGIVEFGVALYDKAVVTNASREAARAGIVLRQPKLTAAQIRDIALDHCATNLISFGDAAPPSVTVSGNAGGGFGTPLTVTVSYAYSGLALGSLIGALSGPIQLAATTTMNNE